MDHHPDNAAAPVGERDDITLRMYLPEHGWLTLICIPRAKLGELCLTPVKWLLYFASNVYGADGEIFSKVYSDDAADEDEIMTDVGSEEEEQQQPAVEENHGESGEEPAPKAPVEETTILSPAALLEEIPAICYFWSKYAPRVLDLQMISDRKSTKSTSDTGWESRLPPSVKERDGDTCVFHASIPEEVSRDCVQACHFVPQSKGNEYVECLERFHEVSPEDQMHVVDTSLNVICMKDSWHRYVTKARAAILLVPNRFLSKEDIKFTAKPRFREDGQPYSDVLRREDKSHNDGQSEPFPTHPGFGGEEEYQPPPSSSEQGTPVRVPSERLRDIEMAIAKAERKQEEKEAVEAAEQALAHLTSGRGYAKFQKPTEEPFNDESQLVLQYFVTGREGVSHADMRTVPHNTPALLREGTHLSVAALHAAYTCAVWKAFSPSTTDSILTPRIPRCDHYGLQRTQHNTSGPTSGEGSGSRTAPASTSHSHSHTFAGQQQQRDERDERGWDLLLGWSTPSVVARQKAEMRRARRIERELGKARVMQWNGTLVP
ncbi:hypothetical protein FB451DRAFT_1552917 [Mycena latifolia]|nr:hypothetical protein FB451DRAFT_1552917 [Mycena latifolia]